MSKPEKMPLSIEILAAPLAFLGEGWSVDLLVAVVAVEVEVADGAANNGLMHAAEGATKSSVPMSKNTDMARYSYAESVHAKGSHRFNGGSTCSSF